MYTISYNTTFIQGILHQWEVIIKHVFNAWHLECGRVVSQEWKAHAHHLADTRTVLSVFTVHFTLHSMLGMYTCTHDYHGMC